MRDFEAEITLVATNKLKPSKDNARIHTKKQIDFLCELIETFGFDQPIVTDGNMVIIKGHGRLMAAKQLKMKKVPVLIRKDMKKAYADLSRIVDNDTVEKTWDEDTLTLEVASLDKLDTDFGDEVNQRLGDMMMEETPRPELESPATMTMTTDFKHTCPHCEYRWD